MTCKHCGRAIVFDKKKRVLHAEPIKFGKVDSYLFCPRVNPDSLMTVATK